MPVLQQFIIVRSRLSSSFLLTSVAVMWAVRSRAACRA